MIDPVFLLFSSFLPSGIVIEHFEKEWNKKVVRTSRGVVGDQSSELWETRGWGPGVAPHSSSGQTGLGLYLVGGVKKGEMMRKLTFREETLVEKTNPDWFYRH